MYAKYLGNSLFTSISILHLKLIFVYDVVFFALCDAGLNKLHVKI